MKPLAPEYRASGSSAPSAFAISVSAEGPAEKAVLPLEPGASPVRVCTLPSACPQLMGPAFGEETLLRIAYAYESATDWHTRTAQL